MVMRLENKASGPSSGSTVTASNSYGPDQFVSALASGAGNTLTFDAGHVHWGDTAVKAAIGGTAGAAYGTFTFTAVATTYCREYVWFAALPSSSTRLMAMVDSAGSLLRGGLYINSSGKILTVNSAGSTIATSSTTIPTGQWVRLEFDCTGDAATGVLTCRIYLDPESWAPPTETLNNTSVNTGGTIGQWWVGSSDSGTTNSTHWYQQLVVTDVGPVGPDVKVGAAPSQLHPGVGPSVPGRFFTGPRETTVIPPPVPVMPPGTSTRRRVWWPSRWPRAGQPVPAQVVVVTVQALPPQPGRRPPRIPIVPRRRPALPIQVTVAVPPQPVIRRRVTPFRPRRRGVPAPLQVTVTLPPQPARQARTWVPRGRPRPGQLVPPQVAVVTTQALPPQPARRAPRFTPRARPRNAAAPVQVTVTVPPQPARQTRGWLPRKRPRAGQLVPAQVTVQTAQQLPPQPTRRPARQPITGHPRATQPVPVVVTMQALPPQATARLRVPLPRRQPRPTAPPLRVTVTVPAQPAVRRRAWLPRRKSRAAQPVPAQVVVVTIQSLPPQPGRRAPMWLPRRRPRTGQTPPPQVIIPVVGLAGSIGYIGEGPMAGDIDRDVDRDMPGDSTDLGPMDGAVAYDVPRSMIGGIDN